MQDSEAKQARMKMEAIGEWIVIDRDVSVRRMRHAREDYALVAHWLSDPRVLRWYEGRDQAFSIGDVMEKFAPRAMADEDVRPCIIHVAGKPAGYIQYYPVTDAADYELDDAAGAWAFDLFLGEPALWGSGAGTRTLRAMARHVFENEGARIAVIDPRVANHRAVHSYEKAGFRRAKVLRAHERHEGALRDCWLMLIDAAPQAGI